MAADAAAPKAQPRKFRLKDITEDRRVALMLALGFACGLPILLVFSTLSAWLATAWRAGSAAAAAGWWRHRSRWRSASSA